MTLIPVVLCGGSGSRLWPVSRRAHPKPFIRLSDGESLLQKAYLRASSLPGVKEILIVGASELFFKMEEELRRVNVARLSNRFILEPSPRNTAAAIATAALQLASQHGEEAVMVVFAADHLIENLEGLTTAVERARQLAELGKLVTFGIRPTAPETGFGYIHSLGDDVLSFIEKPSLERAQQFIDDGNFYWNSGIFCFSAATMIAEMKQHCPKIIEAAQACLMEARTLTSKTWVRTELGAALFSAVPEDSVDFAVFERSDRVAVVPCDLGWSDIGSWAAVGDLLSADAQGNRVVGDVWTQDARNCHIQSEGRTIGVVGVNNLVVVDTPDALLIVDRNSVQGVKNLYASLQAKNHEVHRLHRTVHRPWGTYTVLEGGSGFKLKRIEVRPQASLSLQMHRHRSEHWVVVSGVAEVVNGEETLVLRANESTYIPAGNCHRLTNPGVIDLVMIEVQCGEYLGEDDIVRYDDIYGRVDEVMPVVPPGKKASAA